MGSISTFYERPPSPFLLGDEPRSLPQEIPSPLPPSSPASPDLFIDTAQPLLNLPKTPPSEPSEWPGMPGFFSTAMDAHASALPIIQSPNLVSENTFGISSAPRQYKSLTPQVPDHTHVTTVAPDLSSSSSSFNPLTMGPYAIVPAFRPVISYFPTTAFIPMQSGLCSTLPYFSCLLPSNLPFYEAVNWEPPLSNPPLAVASSSDEVFASHLSRKRGASAANLPSEALEAPSRKKVQSMTLSQQERIQKIEGSAGPRIAFVEKMLTMRNWINLASDQSDILMRFVAGFLASPHSLDDEILTRVWTQIDLCTKTSDSAYYFKKKCAGLCESIPLPTRFTRSTIVARLIRTYQPSDIFEGANTDFPASDICVQHLNKMIANSSQLNLFFTIKEKVTEQLFQKTIDGYYTEIT